MSNIEERLDKVRELIQEPEFLEGKGLSNEVNIRIFATPRKMKWQFVILSSNWKPTTLCPAV